jgi:prepilin peptidase CpaA
VIPVYLALAGCLAAIYDDVQFRRIPNWLTGTIAVAAIAVHAFLGLRAVAVSVAVMIAILLLGTFVYALGGIGGGDVKLAIAVCGMLSYPLCVPFLLYTAIGGGLLALAFIVLRRSDGSLARAVLSTIGGPRAVDRNKALTMPYAIAFTFGAAMVALGQSVAPMLRISL